jgi:hypothetical protein
LVVGAVAQSFDKSLAVPGPFGNDLALGISDFQRPAQAEELEPDLCGIAYWKESSDARTGIWNEL